MIRLQTVLALLLLCLWLPCTMHCQAEALGWLGSNSSCCEQGHAGDSSAPDCADCATCSAIEFGGYSLVDSELINAEHGLGYLLMTSQRRGLSEHIILILLVIGLLAFGIDRILFWFQRGLFPHRVVED